MEASGRILKALSATDRGDTLVRFADWLRSEAIPAGGLGPGEADRLDQRHLADSLAIAEAWWPESPDSLLDLGSGVGLPGIPLAILHPGTQVTLLDRSGRRASLIRRAIRVLELPNVLVIQSDMSDHTGSYRAVVARGVTEPNRLLPDLRRLVDAPGWGVVAGSRVERPECPGFVTREVGRGILDPPGWILIMA